MWSWTVLGVVLWWPLAVAVPDDPRQDPYLRSPVVAELMESATFQLSFDAETLVPDMAAGAAKPQVFGRPRYAAGVHGRALVAGDGSGGAIYERARNAPLSTRGAVALWVKPVSWTRRNGGNTVFLMTTNATFYLQRQGPAHNAEGQVTRHEGVQFLLLAKSTDHLSLMDGTAGWPARWRLIVANWSWPTMSWSIDGGPFASATAKAPPAASDFGNLIVGAGDGEATLLDELTIFRRPLTQDEAKALYATFMPAEKAP